MKLKSEQKITGIVEPFTRDCELFTDRYGFYYCRYRGKKVSEIRHKTTINAILDLCRHLENRVEEIAQGLEVIG